MDRMLVVVFDTETKAYAGKQALIQLDNEGSISLYAYAVVGKNADGTANVKQGDDPGPLGTLTGTAVGSLIGLLGGPVGFAIGAASGMVAGGAVDLHNARIGEDFVADVTKELTPGKFAVVAEVQEDWTTPVDVRMEAIGGTGIPAGALRSDAHRSRKRRHRYESRRRPDESGACEGSRRPESQDPGEDQQARLQDPGPSGESQGTS